MTDQPLHRQRCSNCLHFQEKDFYPITSMQFQNMPKEYKTAIGHCRREPPSYGKGETDAFPRVGKDAWCSLWTSKESGND